MKMLSLEKSRTASYEKNIERLGEWSDTCVCCGQRTAQKLFIQMTTDGNLVDSIEELENSQGFFPTGPECLKKFNKLANE